LENSRSGDQLSAKLQESEENDKKKKKILEKKTRGPS